MFAANDSSDAAMLVLGTVLGAVLGASICLIATTFRATSSLRRKAALDAHATWLAARLTMSRTTLSFVASFRALAAEPGDSTYFALRSNEAQRARQDWCDGMKALDGAEAGLIAWSDDPAICNRLAMFDRVSSDLIRKAIDGDAEDVERLVEHFRRTDRDAIDFIRGESGESHLTFGVRAFGKTLAACRDAMSRVIDRWSR